MRLLESFRNLARLPEVRRRVSWTLGLLAAFRVGAHLPLPGVHPAAIHSFAESASRAMRGLWSFLELLSGGALGKLALFALGIAPYITASILVQMLTKASATLEAIAKEGPAGQKRIQQIVRVATIPIALLQAAFAAWHLRAARLLASDGVMDFVLVVAGMTAGSILTLWIGEQITERGLGNGQSLLILAGIVSRLQALAGETIRRAKEGSIAPATPLVLGILALATIVATVIVTKAQRRIPLHHAKQVRGRRILDGGRNYLPLRLNSAGVMPIIFSSSVFVLPQILGLVPGLQWLRAPFERLGFVFTTLYAAAVIFFSYFWTYLFFPPSELALQLKERGSFVPGLRPGEVTERFLGGILARITLCGAVFLAGIALLPGLVARALGGEVLWEAFLGGSSLLIVVGVVLDLVQKLDSYLQMHRYEGFLRPTKS